MYFVARIFAVCGIVFLSGIFANSASASACGEMCALAAKGNTVAFAARMNEIIAEGGDPFAPGYFGGTPQHYAARHGHPDIFRVFADAGANLNAQDVRGLTPYFVAVVAGHFDTARAITQRGGLSDIPDENGWTPLLYAISKNDIPFVSLSIARGYNAQRLNNAPLEATNEGITPPMMAAYVNSTAILQMLIDNFPGMDLDRTSGRGVNAMMTASAFAYRAAGCALWPRITKPNARDQHGRTAYMMAIWAQGTSTFRTLTGCMTTPFGNNPHTVDTGAVDDAGTGAEYFNSLGDDGVLPTPNFAVFLHDWEWSLRKTP